MIRQEGIISEKYNKTIEPHFYGVKDMLRKDPLVREILRNGIEL